MPYRLEQCIHPHVRCAWDPGSSPQVWSGNLPGVGTLLLVLCQARVCESCRATPLNRPMGLGLDRISARHVIWREHQNVGRRWGTPKLGWSRAVAAERELRGSNYIRRRTILLHSTRAIKRAAAPSPPNIFLHHLTSTSPHLHRPTQHGPSTPSRAHQSQQKEQAKGQWPGRHVPGRGWRPGVTCRRDAWWQVIVFLLITVHHESNRDGIM
jgi:hypothetical protein